MSDDENGEHRAENDNEEGCMPWSAFNASFAFVREMDEKNFLARCKLCHEEKKCAVSTSNNLKSHLKRKHHWSEQKLQELSVFSRKKPKRDTPGSTASASCSVGSFFQPRQTKAINQNNLNELVDRLVVFETLPHKIVDSQHFKAAVMFGIPPEKGLKITCRQSLRKRLNGHHEKMLKNLKVALAAAKHVATTADGWSKFRRGFLGMTVTWLDPSTIARSHAALALRRLKGRHTHDRLAAAMARIHEEYDLIVPKLTKTITDTAANFRKAFKVFSSAPISNESTDADEDGANDNSDDEEEIDDPDDNEDGCVPLSLTQVLDDELDVNLPPHQRCAAHIINLIGIQDVKVTLDLNVVFRKMHEATTYKLKEWWRRQNRSDLVAAALQEGLGVKLQVPGDTRWNSEYDARAQIVKLMDDEQKLNETLESAGLNKLTSAEAKYLREYVWVMTPIAQALDILQRDKDMFIGYIIPTVLSMEKQVQARRTMNAKPLKYCDVLARTLKNALCEPKRFSLILKDRDLMVAATLLPCFKLSWTTDSDLQFEIKEKILDEMVKVEASLDGNTQVTSCDNQVELDQEEEIADQPSPLPVSPLSLSSEDIFFGFEPSEVEIEKITKESCTQELNRYLAEASRKCSVQYCYAVGENCQRKYPRMANVFLKYNTALPSSASVERFFSMGGHCFNPKRNGMSDDTLNIECCLKANEEFWM